MLKKSKSNNKNPMNNKMNLNKIKNNLSLKFKNNRLFLLNSYTKIKVFTL